MLEVLNRKREQFFFNIKNNEEFCIINDEFCRERQLEASVHGCRVRALRNVDFMLKNLECRLKNVDFTIKTGTREEARRGKFRRRGQVPGIYARVNRALNGRFCCHFDTIGGFWVSEFG